MGESLYGKFGFNAVKIGFILFFITFFISMTFGWLLPDFINSLIVLGFIILIVGIILAIVSIIKDTLKEKAIRSLIAGFCFLFMGIALIVLFNIYIGALLG